MKKTSKSVPSVHRGQVHGLRGQWAFESIEINGTQMPTPSFPSGQLLIDGDRFRVESPEATYEGVFTTDIDRNPPHIDIEFVEGPETGEWSHGIYAIEGDELTICLGLTGATRPTRFATTKHSGHALERFHRVSAERPVSVARGKRTRRAAISTEPSPPVDESAFTQGMTTLLERLQGEWLPVSLITNGAALQSAFLAYGSRMQTGNETRVVFGGQTMVHALMRLDESVSPVAIDYLNIGKGLRVVSLGILECGESEMRICMAKPGDRRPPDFSCERGSGRTLSTWKRG